MEQTGKFAGKTTVIASAVLLAVVAALLIGPGHGAAHAPQARAACPTFRVLGDDRIGSAVLPKGTYSIKSFGRLSCAQASSQFTRFLQDYDGNLPDHYTVIPNGRGKATFAQRGTPRFAVSRKGGGGNGGHHPSPSLGTRCAGTFRVLHNDRIGSVSFPKGSYLLYIPPQSKVGCTEASKLFTKFLSKPSGALPGGWRIKARTALFFKPQSPIHRRFRVDPST